MASLIRYSLCSVSEHSSIFYMMVKKENFIHFHLLQFLFLNCDAGEWVELNIWNLGSSKKHLSNVSAQQDGEVKK